MEDLNDGPDDDEAHQEVVEVPKGNLGKTRETPLHYNDAYFYIGPKREKIMAGDLVHTSSVPLHNEKWFTDLDGVVKKAGYLSSSSMSAYAKCHQFYFRKYILKEEDIRPAVNLWTGSGFHNVLEEAGIAKIAGKTFSNDQAVQMFRKHMDKEFTKYDDDSAKLLQEGKDPRELKLPERIPTRDALVKLGMDMVDKFLEYEFPLVRPKTVEERVIYPMEVNSGGAIPFVGYIDLIEEENGELVVTDYKTGRLRTQENLDMDQQLPRYARAKKIYKVKWFSIKMGTTGGKTPARAKGPETLKLRRTVTVKDMEILHEDDNLLVEGIKAGNFARTGLQNSQICGSRLCPFWHNCLGKK